MSFEQQFQQSYIEMQQSSSEGMYLDIKIPSERWRLYLNNANILPEITQMDKNQILSLVEEDSVPHFVKLNPYCLVFAYWANKKFPNGPTSVDMATINQKIQEIQVTDPVYKQSLSDIIQISDVYRYMRLLKRLSSKQNVSMQDFQQQEEIDYNMEQDYDEEFNNFDDYNDESD